MAQDINRLKVVLAEKKRTNKWLSEQGKICHEHYCGCKGRKYQVGKETCGYRFL